MRSFVVAKTLPHVKTLMLITCMGSLILGWTMTGSVTWAQTPRPTLTPGPTSTPTQEPGLTPSATSPPMPTSTAEPEVQPQAPSGYAGPLLKGRVLDLSTGQPKGGMKVVFSAEDVSVEVMSDENGEYAFQHLGSANGLLNVVPSRESGLSPVTVDVAVQPKTGVEMVVNLGVAPNRTAMPPLIPTVELTPDYVRSGENLTITVLVKNILPQGISGATVTSWLPDRVVPVAIHSSTGNPYFSGNLAIVELGSLDEGSGALIEIVARVSGAGVSASTLRGNISFFYREHAAAQAQSTGLSNGAAPTVLPVTGVGLPVMGLGLLVIIGVAGWMRRRLRRRSSPTSPTK